MFVPINSLSLSLGANAHVTRSQQALWMGINLLLASRNWAKYLDT